MKLTKLSALATYVTFAINLLIWYFLGYMPRIGSMAFFILLLCTIVLFFKDGKNEARRY